jgi:hypothetical protein
MTRKWQALSSNSSTIARAASSSIRGVSSRWLSASPMVRNTFRH